MFDDVQKAHVECQHGCMLVERPDWWQASHYRNSCHSNALAFAIANEREASEVKTLLTSQMSPGRVTLPLPIGFLPARAGLP